MAEPRIYVETGDKLEPYEDTLFKDEDELQALLARHVELMSGDRDVGEWLLVTREADVPDDAAAPGRWSLDHLFVTQDAVPSLVEVKRASDTRIRREVVGQLLDYAANGARYWSADKLAEFAKCTQGASYGERMRAFLKLDDSDELGASADAFWRKVETNLGAGRMRLVFAADRLPSELVTVIEFLNRSMPNIEVLGLQVQQYVFEGKKVIVTRTRGEVEADRRPADQPLPTNAAVRAFLEKVRSLVNARLGDRVGQYTVAKSVRKQLSYWKGSVGASYVVHFGGYLRDDWTPIVVGVEVQLKTTAQRDRVAEIIEGLVPQLPPGIRVEPSAKAVSAVLKVDWATDDDLNEALATKLAATLVRVEAVVSPHLPPVEA